MPSATTEAYVLYAREAILMKLGAQKGHLRNFLKHTQRAARLETLIPKKSQEIMAELVFGQRFVRFVRAVA